jgi:hypothetical protein
MAFLALAGCSASPPTRRAAPVPVAKKGPAFDPCAGSPPVPRKFFGLLKDAKCEQDMYLTMAKIAGDLGVDCNYCHVQDPSDSKKFDFPKMTDRKQVALFMGHDFMDGLRRKDGAEMRCKSCHVDKNGKPAAKFLGTPRDLAWTTEWMNLVMSNRFVHTDGTKVKCRDCHAATVGQDDFDPKVIAHGDRVKLPGVTPFVRFLETGLPPGATVEPTPSSAPPAPIAPPSASARP